MNPFYSEEHEAYRLKVREFAENEIRPIAAQLDEDEMFSVELTQKMGQFGLLGLQVPQQYGGQNRDTISYIIAVEELSRIDGSQAVTVAAHNSLGIAPILSFGSEEQKQKYLPQLCTGEALWAFGLTEENAGSDARGVETTATIKNQEWLINGTKRYITNGSSQLLAGITLMAITGRDGDKPLFSNILVDRNTEGFNTKRMLGKMMWRASDTAELSFNNCKVPKENLLGETSKGASQMLKTLDSGRLSIAAMGLGLAKGAHEHALAYASKRKQFGKEINRFQSISFKLAEMATKIENAENTLYKACWLKDHNQPFGKEAAMAKLYCSEVAFEVSDEAVQILSGAGLFKGTEVERFYRDQRILRIGEGTSEILKLVIGRHIGIK